MDLDETLTDLLERHGDRWLRLAFQLSHDRATAEDLVQQALETVYRSWRRRGARADHADAYVRRAIVNEYLRRRRLRSATEVVTADLPELAVSADMDTFADRDDLWRRLEALPARQRAVLVLRYYEDVPDREIATFVGCRETTVRSLAARGLAALRAGNLAETEERHHG